jgi:hypothetical protein
MVNRRHFLRLAAAGMAYPALSNFGRPRLQVDAKNIVLTEEALRIHRSAIVVDGHNDLPYKLRLKGPFALETLDLMTNQPEFHTDIPRLIKGGIGSDFDGIPAGPDYLEDVSYFPYITQVLLNRGYKEQAIHKILGGNFLRVFKMAEEIK